ncbi:MAG: hypothetical protein NZ697_01930 [Porticoccaceae bacterium]|nr:hypothetical protein [Porticoccaceae bacterium]
MSHSKFDSTNQNLSNKKASEDRDYLVDWINGSQVFSGQLPSLDKEPIPAILHDLPFPHPDQPRGSSAMLHGNSARHRIGHLRVGAWTIAPRSGWHYVKSPSGIVEWIPKDADLPQSLYVPSSKRTATLRFRNYIQ